MKKILLMALTCFAFVAPGLAGTEYAPGKDYKAPVELPTCFGDREFQIDVFGAYVDGNAQQHAGPIRDHGWGGGIGLTYFFTRMIGIGADASWIYARENGSVAESGERNFQSFTGSIFVRFPSDSTCLAPYLFLGGG
ncbi:MAG: hypothetical protein V4710_02650, partial [Verrucomicrobiota bacterium]